MYYKGFDFLEMSASSYHSFIFDETIEDVLFMHVDAVGSAAIRAKAFFQTRDRYSEALKSAFKLIELGSRMGVVRDNGEVTWHTDFHDEVYFV